MIVVRDAQSDEHVLAKVTLVDPLTSRELGAIYRKLGVGSRQDAVAEAHRLGIR